MYVEHNYAEEVVKRSLLLMKVWLDVIFETSLIDLGGTSLICSCKFSAHKLAVQLSLTF